MRLLPVLAIVAVTCAFTCAGPALARDEDNAAPLGDTADGSEPNVPSNANQAHDRFNSETRAKSDDMLATAVSKSLHDDPAVSAMQVKVAVDKGVVTLTGEVPGNDEKSAAERAAQRTAGVREVRNQITVANQVAPAPGTSPIPERPSP